MKQKMTFKYFLLFHFVSLCFYKYLNISKLYKNTVSLVSAVVHARETKQPALLSGLPVV